jgi:hypothetical protein
MSELALDSAAAKPLKHPKYEVFARQRALNQSPLIAGQIAGLNYDRRNLYRIEKKPAVAARIAWLSRQDEETLREKRNRLEQFLWMACSPIALTSTRPWKSRSPIATAMPR